MTAACPNCGSERTRRGGNGIWAVYLVLIALAIPAVLILQLHAGLVAGILLAAVLTAHLALDTKVCLDCGNQWK